ncbi:MAG: hypothetical protein ACQEXJ_15525 [Myxococcota bacterium]
MSDPATSPSSERVAKIYAWQAVVVALITAIGGYFGGRMRTADAAAHPPRLARKPLEGHWKYRARYANFHGRAGEPKWVGEGEASIQWVEGEDKYRMLLGGSVFSLEAGGANPSVVYVIDANLRANPDGTLKSRRSEFAYVAAMGKRWVSPRASYYFDVVEMALPDAGGSYSRMTLRYKSSNTEGRFYLERE